MKRDYFRRTVIVTALMAIFASTSAAAEATSLIEAIGLARKNDPVYRGALGEYVAGMASRDQGRAGLRPQISFSATQGRARLDREFIGRNATPSIEEDLSTYNRTLQLRQTLYSADAFARAELGQKRAEIADSALNTQLGNLVNRIMKAYLDVVAAQQELELATASIDHAKTQRKLAESQLSGGEATRVELEEAKAREDIAAATEAQARNGVDLALRVLSGFTGAEIRLVNTLSADFRPLTVDEALFDQWRDRLLESNPEIVTARKAVELQERELERRRSADLPRLDFVLFRSQLQSDTVNISNQRIDQTAANLQLQIPIYTGGAYGADVEQQEGAVTKAQADVDETARKLTTDLRKAWSVLNSAPARLSALERAVQASELLVRSAELGVQNKVKVMADVLDARRQLTQARRDLGKARMEVIDAQLQALVLSGELNEENLLDVEQYFQKR